LIKGQTPILKRLIILLKGMFIELAKGKQKEIINKAKLLNYEYVGLSDHSPGVSTHAKNQIIKIIEKRKKKAYFSMRQLIKKWPKRLSKSYLKNK